MRLPGEFADGLREWWCAWCGWSAHRRELNRAGGFCPRCGSAELVDDGVTGGGGPPSRLDSREALRTGLPGFSRGLRGKGGPDHDAIVVSVDSQTPQPSGKLESSW